MAAVAQGQWTTFKEGVKSSWRIDLPLIVVTVLIDLGQMLSIARASVLKSP
jgi:hypothetical protein